MEKWFSKKSDPSEKSPKYFFSREDWEKSEFVFCNPETQKIESWKDTI